MYKLAKRLGSKALVITLVLAFETVPAIKATAQLVAGLTASTTGGCTPLTVSFKNTSTGGSSTTVYNWNFGNGNSTTTTNVATNVAAIYYNPQTYTVTLTATDKGVSSVQTVQIAVYEKPTVSFSPSTLSGCVPLAANFSSSSTAGSGNIAQYFWDFGDGNTLSSSSPNVVNNYTTAGGYEVSLTVTNSFGCATTLQNGASVSALGVPNVSFSAGSTALCQAGDSVSFTNASSDPGPLTYSWNFGDGTVSTVPNPEHTYLLKGSYSVQLTAINAQGCKSSLLIPSYVNVAQFNPNFSVSGGTYCSGSQLTFTDISTPTPNGSPTWSFSNGATGTGTPVSERFATPGTYQVTMTDYFGSCVDSVTNSIVISAAPQINGFIFDKPAACQTPVTVQFTDTSKGSVKWLWNFTGNPGDTSSQQDPSFTFLANKPYTPSLTVTNAAGCSSTVNDTIYPSGTSASIALTKSFVPSSVICADVSVTASAVSGDSIAQYNWNFGDGYHANTANPNHIYTIPGTYTVSLSYTTVGGCTGTVTSTDTIVLYTKPHANFTAVDSIPCAKNQVEIFTNLADSSASFTWLYGDGSSEINNGVTHAHTYQNAGNYQMTLIASNPGCKSDTMTITKYVQTAPIPAGQPAYSCSGNGNTITLTSSTGGGSEYIWYWGDGSVNDTDYVYLSQRTHTYPGPGIYSASITGVFGTCIENSGPINIYITGFQNPVLSSTADTLCQSAPFPVLISGLDTNYMAVGNNNSSYYSMVAWQYKSGGQFSSTAGFGTSYTANLQNLALGTDSIRAIIRVFGYNCSDTTNYIPITIIGPQANFGFNQVTKCFNVPVTFTDSSKQNNGIPIISWTWKFGDGDSVVRATGDTVIYQYQLPGNYKPSLTVTDSLGCTATATLPINSTITESGTNASFTWSPTIISPGNPVTFQNTSISLPGTTYQWYFYSNGATSNSANSVTHTYSRPLTDTVRLIALSASPTCPDTAIQVLNVVNVSASFTYTSKYVNVASCPPVVAYFVSTTFHAVRIHWTFGDGATADNNPTPSHTYNLPGVYEITLTAYGSGGDSAVSQDTLTIKGPYATLYSSLSQACGPALDTLHATAKYADSYTWDYGDGTVLITSDTLSSHTYGVPGIYTPVLILQDSTGCQASFPLDHKIAIDGLQLNAGPLVLMCDTGIARLNSTFKSLSYDSLGLPLSFHWNFGTGNPGDTAATQNALFDYTQRGNYIASIQASTQLGCTAIAYDTVQIVPMMQPVPSPDSSICAGLSVRLLVTGAYKYQWLPDSSLNNISGGSALATPTQSTVYSVICTDQYLCFTDTVNIHIQVIQLPSVKTLPVVSVLAGSSVNLLANSSPDVVSWNWSPSNYLSCTDCISPISTPDQPITYGVTVSNSEGCVASDTVAVRILCSETSVQIPNAFTPNGDGRNDLFFPSGKAIKIIRSFRIYNRWGQLVYEIENADIHNRTLGWDGRFRGVMQPLDTYVYMAEIECFTGEVFPLKGTVELIR